MIALLLAACTSLPNWLNHIRFAGLDISIVHILDTYGYVMVALFIAVESTGIPFPGETMLVSASVYAAQGCGLQEPWVIVACIIGATMGDNIGFWVGRTGGRALIRKLPFVKESHLAPAEAYFQRYGAATVFFGRFLAVLRAWAAFLAGVNRMAPLTFFLCNFFGAVIWSIAFGLLGYELGKNLTSLQTVLTNLGYAGTVIIVLLVIAAIFGVRRYLHAEREKAADTDRHAHGTPEAEIVDPGHRTHEAPEEKSIGQDHPTYTVPEEEPERLPQARIADNLAPQIPDERIGESHHPAPTLPDAKGPQG